MAPGLLLLVFAGRMAKPKCPISMSHVSEVQPLAEAHGYHDAPQGTTFAVKSQGMSFSVLVWEPVPHGVLMCAALLELTLRFLKVLFVYGCFQK